MPVTSSLPHRQLRNVLSGTAGANAGSLPHRQLRNAAVGVDHSAQRSLPHRQLRKLATLPLDTPTSGSVDVAGEAPALLALLSLTPVSGLASAQGLVGFARIADGAGVGIVDLRAGPPGSELPVILSALQLYMGGEVKLLSCLISE